MIQPRIRTFVKRSYVNVSLALWSVLIASAIYFAIFVAPNMPRARALYQAQRAAQIEAEHDFYCRKWRMAPGSEIYRGCMSDLQQFRRSVEQRLADEELF